MPSNNSFSKQHFLLSLFLFFSCFATPAFADQGLAKAGFDIKNYQGKIVYVDFWASWCGPCRKSFPTMNQFQQEYGKDNLVIIGINLDKEKKLADKFLQQYPANFEIIYDPEGRIATQFKVQAMPSTYIFNSRGEAKYLHKGFRQKDVAKLKQHIETLLLEKPPELPTTSSKVSSGEIE